MAQYYKTKHCQQCGCKFVANAHNTKFCPKCGQERKHQYQQAYKAKKRKEKAPAIKANSLNKVMADLNAYNEKHGKKLSYGQYVAAMEGRLKV